MMIGSPGTGKSMLAKAMSQLLPKEDLQDVLVYHNPDDGNEPKVRNRPCGEGRTDHRRSQGGSPQAQPDALDPDVDHHRSRPRLRDPGGRAAPALASSRRGSSG